MSGVALSNEAFKRIASATRRVERTPTNLAGDRSPSHDATQGFWAILFGADISGLRYTFNKVVPDPKSVFPEAFTLSQTLRFGFDGEAVWQAAVEANGARGLPPGTVVWMRFIGYDADEQPAYMFSHPRPDPLQSLPPHDHRDNDNGGFAFATYHPGTSVPSMPWAM